MAVAETTELSPPDRAGNAHWFANRGFTVECPYHHQADCDQENRMVALNEQFHHNDMPSRLQVTGAGRIFRSWELGVRRLWKRCAPECEMPDAGNSGSEYLWISALITDHGGRI